MKRILALKIKNLIIWSMADNLLHVLIVQGGDFSQREALKTTKKETARLGGLFPCD